MYSNLHVCSFSQEGGFSFYLGFYFLTIMEKPLCFPLTYQSLLVDLSRASVEASDRLIYVFPIALG